MLKENIDMENKHLNMVLLLEEEEQPYRLVNPWILHHKVIIMLRAPIISQSEVFIMVLVHPVTQQSNQELLESTFVIKVATIKIRWFCIPQLSSETKVAITLYCQLCSSCCTAVQIKNCLKKHLCIQHSHY